MRGSSLKAGMRQWPKRIGTALAGAVSFFLAGSCGYQFAVRGELPEGIRSIRFASFQNKTGVAGIEKEVELSLKSVLRERGRWNVIDGEGDAEAVFSGTVIRFENSPSSFSRRDFAVEYGTAITVDLSLVRGSDGKTLWNRKGMHQEQTYGIVPEAVVTSSPQFRQGSLTAGNLSNFTEISLAETQRKAAQTRLLEQLAEDVYRSLTSRF